MPKQETIYSLGENALTITFGNEWDAAISHRVFSIYNYLRKQASPFWKDLIPAYCTLTVVYDSSSIRRHHPSAVEWVRREIENALRDCGGGEPSAARKLQVPVCYDAAFGLDLKTIARARKLSVEKVIALHTQQAYRVYMLGFLPGFAYMGFVSEEIAAPRLASPRRHVPAGSVGIAGNQTGIYPLDSPGGWNIIGRTPVRLFDPESESPAFLQPGDEVTFVPISREAYESFDAENFQLVRP